MNIYDLKHEIMEKKLRKHQTYETIYDKVVSKIKFTNSNTNNCYCMYEFKRFEFGIPRYNVSECMSYICEKLRRAKFKVGLLESNKIIISWLHILEQQTQSERVINSQVSLMDLKEQQELKKQNQLNNLLLADSNHIKQSSHFGDTLQQFPLYNLQSTIPAIDYVKTNEQSSSMKPVNNSLTSGVNRYNSPTKTISFHKGGKKQKSQAEIQSSLELDNLLSQFDNTSLL